MIYSKNDVLDYIREEDVRFIKLAFCDVTGKQKNVSIMPSEIERAFDTGISVDASAIKGFGDETKSDLFLIPDSSTLQVLPWRSLHGRVIRMYCDIKNPDGTAFELDCRNILKKAVKDAGDLGVVCDFGAEFEFYLFKTDEQGNPTLIPHDNAEYMDIAPDDRGENIRREICLTLEQMGITPESSHHEEGPGQHEIDFKYSEPQTAADNAVTFKSVVKTIAAGNGLYADFSPKPIAGKSGNGMHINISVMRKDKVDCTNEFMAGIMKHITEITAFLNSTEDSYKRLGEAKAPKYVSWSHENRSQLIRIPAAAGEYKRIELRSPDPEANPYLSYALLIYAGLDGIKNNLKLPEEKNINLFKVSDEELSGLVALPENYAQAVKLAKESDFVKSVLPSSLINVL